MLPVSASKFVSNTIEALAKLDQFIRHPHPIDRRHVLLATGGLAAGVAGLADLEQTSDGTQEVGTLLWQATRGVVQVGSTLGEVAQGIPGLPHDDETWVNGQRVDTWTLTDEDTEKLSQYPHIRTAYHNGGNTAVSIHHAAQYPIDIIEADIQRDMYLRHVTEHNFYDITDNTQVLADFFRLTEEYGITPHTDVWLSATLDPHALAALYPKDRPVMASSKEHGILDMLGAYPNITPFYTASDEHGVQAIVDRRKPFRKQFGISLNKNVVADDVGNVNTDLLLHLRDRGVLVQVWTVNYPKIATALAPYVYGITSDNLDMLSAFKVNALVS